MLSPVLLTLRHRKFRQPVLSASALHLRRSSVPLLFLIQSVLFVRLIV